MSKKVDVKANDIKYFNKVLKENSIFNTNKRFGSDDIIKFTNSRGQTSYVAEFSATDEHKNINVKVSVSKPTVWSVNEMIAVKDAIAEKGIAHVFKKYKKINVFETDEGKKYLTINAFDSHFADAIKNAPVWEGEQETEKTTKKQQVEEELSF